MVAFTESRDLGDRSLYDFLMLFVDKPTRSFSKMLGDLKTLKNLLQMKMLI